jgi:hypothetical protein
MMLFAGSYALLFNSPPHHAKQQNTAQNKAHYVVLFALPLGIRLSPPFPRRPTRGKRKGGMKRPEENNKTHNTANKHKP